MLVRKSEPMPTRPCYFAIALQDDSVFADFKINDSDCLRLVRISFDGYGCCHPEESIGEIDATSSKILISSVKKSYSELPEISKILCEYFCENKSFLWEDALQDHGLI